jgi:hypothetical protein
MGNRAVLSFGPEGKSTPGIYLHWNGGRASVEGILSACKTINDLAGLTVAEKRDRVASVAASFIGGSTYVGEVGKMDCDNWDNGLYTLNPDTLEIVGRNYTRGKGEEVDAKKTAEIREACLRTIADVEKLETKAAQAAAWDDFFSIVNPN